MAPNRYHDAVGSFPMGAGNCLTASPNTYTSKQAWSIHSAILPQLEQIAAYNSLDFSWGVDENASPIEDIQAAFATQIKAFLCPSDPGSGSSYRSSNNYFGSLGTTTYYTNSEADSFHAGGVNTLMADGSVRFLKDSINQRTWWALGTKGGSEVISADSY